MNQKPPILLGRRLALFGIDYDMVRRSVRTKNRPPFGGRGEACATPAAKACTLDLSNQLAAGTSEGLVAASKAILGNPLTVLTVLQQTAGTRRSGDHHYPFRHAVGGQLQPLSAVPRR